MELVVKFLDRFTIKQRLRILVALGLALLLSLGTISLTSMQSLASSIDRLTNSDLIAMRAITLSDMYHDGTRALVYQAYFTAVAGSENEILEISQELQGMRREFLDQYTRLEKIEVPDTVKGEIRDVIPVVEEYVGLAAEIVECLIDEKRGAAPKETHSLRERFEEKFLQLETRLGRIADLMETEGQNLAQLDEERIYQANLLVILISLTSAVGTIVLGTLIGKRIADPLSQVFPKLKPVLEGDLRNGFPLEPGMEEFDNELLQMERGLNLLLQKIAETFLKLKSLGEVVSNSTKQLGVTTDKMTQVLGCNSELFCAMQDNFAQVQELTVENQHNVQQIALIAQKTSKLVTSGVELVTGMIERMKEIQESNYRTSSAVKGLSEQIVSIRTILDSITAIADHSKIIAFNAELEASSAGEAGRNFQLVATEIRRLADNTVSFTGEVKKKIEEIEGATSGLVEDVASEARTIEKGSESSHSLNRVCLEIKNSFQEVSTAASTVHVSTESQSKKISVGLSSFKELFSNATELGQVIKAGEENVDALEKVVFNLYEGLNQYKV
jgi:methyl-accepting chemotaxis protein